MTELMKIARRVGLSQDIIEYCLEVELVQPPVDREEQLAELRRIRRLQQLDINLAGIEVILRMRRRMLAMQKEMDQMMAEMRRMEERF